jgi:O-antigen/teichoic acid export membrane protein
MPSTAQAEPRASRTRRFLDGVWLGYANQLLMMLGGLWLTPFLLHRIGQHDYGLWLVASQILMYLTLLDIGVVALLPRETAYATGRAGGSEQAADLPLVVGQAGRIVLYQMPVVILVVVVTWFLLPGSWSGLRGAIGLTMAAFLVAFPLRVFQALLQGLQDFRFLGHTQIIAWAVSMLAIVGLVLRGYGFYALAIGWVLTQLASTAFALYRVWRRFPWVLPRRLPPMAWSDVLAYLKRCFWVSLSQIATPMLGGADILIIGALYGASAVVPYACTKKLISVLSNQPDLVMHAASPGLSELKTGESRDRILRAVTALTQALLMMSGLVACVVLSVNHSFVGWWVGPAQYSGAAISAAMILDMLIRHWKTTAVFSVFCFGYERLISISTLLDGCVTAGAALLLVWLFGPIGGPLGSIVGVCLISLPFSLTALSREVEVSLTALITPLWPWFWRFSILSVAAIAAGMHWGSMKFWGLAVATVLATSIYVAVMFRPALDSALGEYLRPRFMVIWKKMSWATSEVQ